MTSQRRTAQKQAVYDALRALDHPSATEVYAYLQGKEPAVSRGTVFRVLSAFSESGRVWDLQGVPAPLALPEGFLFEESELEVSGVCAACAAKG